MINIKSGGSAIVAGNGGKINIKNVDLKIAETLTEGGTACTLLVDGDNADVTIEDCTIIYRDYAISTNANKVHEGMTVTMKNVEMIPDPKSQRAVVPFLFNVPMTVNATDCLFQGINQGAIFRGGTYNMTGCTFQQLLVPENSPNGLNATTKESIKNKFRNLYREAWGSGSVVPLAALVVGNKGASSYQYPTNVTLTDCTLIVPEVARNTDGDISSSLPAMYVYANSGEGLGVNLTMTGCRYNEVLEFASTNIIYNGRAITLPENIPANMN